MGFEQGDPFYHVLRACQCIIPIAALRCKWLGSIGQVRQVLLHQQSSLCVYYRAEDTSMGLPEPPQKSYLGPVLAGQRMLRISASGIR